MPRVPRKTRVWLAAAAVVFGIAPLACAGAAPASAPTAASDAKAAYALAPAPPPEGDKPAEVRETPTPARPSASHPKDPDLESTAAATATAAPALDTAPTPITYRSRGFAYGKARIDGGDEITLRINGHPVTYGEIAEDKVRFITNRDDMRHWVDTAVPHDEWTPPQGADLNNPRYPVQDFFITPGFRELLELKERYSVNAAVLGGIVKVYASYDAAVKAGFSASDDEVTAHVSEMRSLYEQISKTATEETAKGLGESIGYIEAVGEEKLWGELVPAEARRNLAIAKWKRAAEQEAYGDRGISVKEWSKIERELQLSAIANVNVEIVDKTLFDEATVQDALKYSRESIDARNLE